MSKIAGEINAEMMHPKVIHEQRKALFAEMVRKTGSQQSVLDRLLQEIQFLRDHEGCPMDEEVIDILRGKVAELEAENTLHKSAMDNLAAKLTEAERQRDERVTGFNLTVAAVEAADMIEQLEAERVLDEQRVADLMAQVTDIAAERDELKVDAVRYRWLRDNPWDEELTAVITYHRNALFDSAIDAVIAKGEKHAQA